MGSMASQITSLTIVYSLAFVKGIHRGPVNFPHKWPVTRKMFPFDDVIMCMWYHRTHVISYLACDLLYVISLTLRDDRNDCPCFVGALLPENVNVSSNIFINDQGHYTWLRDMTCTLFLFTCKYMAPCHANVSSTDPWERLPFGQHITWHQDMLIPDIIA